MARKSRAAATAAKTERTRGVRSIEEARAWLADNRIEEIECVVPDQAGVARGKIMPVAKFLEGPTMSMPESIFTQTIAGDWPPDDENFENNKADQDILLEPGDRLE